MTESELLTRLTALQTELAEMARKLGAAEERAEGLQAILDVERRQASELRQDRDRAFEQLEQAQTAHVAELTALHERMAKAEHDRDQALERLNLNIDRLDRVQDEHRAEITVVRDQLAQAQSDRDRAVEALAAHLALPWWRRLFG